MNVTVDTGSVIPIGEQLRSQLEQLIVSGRLSPGEKLPAIRHLAADLGISKGTVAKVYEQLTDDGLISGATRNGTTVTGSVTAKQQAARKQELINQAAAEFARVMRNLGLNTQDATTAFWRATDTDKAS
jgi:DNA-binding transcriptional regulator YhcF (GntR family)